MFNFIPKEVRFYDYFEQQSRHVLKASALLHELVHNFPDARQKMHAIKEVEHQGDAVTHEIVRKLNTTFITPIDREDIHALALALDDVADAIDDCAKLMQLYRLDRVRPGVRELGRILAAQTEHVQKAMEALRDRKGVSVSTAEIDRLEHDGDVAYQQSIVTLFDTEKDPIQIIKWKELYAHLEAATDRCEDIGNVLDGIAVKHA